MRSSPKARHGQRALPSTQPNESAHFFADEIQVCIKNNLLFCRPASASVQCINRAIARKRPHASKGKQQRASSFTCSACG